jgi:cytidylate kinase
MNRFGDLAGGGATMRTSTLPRSRELSEAAERQMRMWALRMESQQRLEEQAAAASPQQLIHPYIAISREAGVDAGEIAKLVATKCGWKILDREILDYMAEHYQWSPIALDYVDERTVSWFHETFGKWLDERLVSQAEYVSRLGRVVLMAAQHESTVFVGRGVQFILPREVGLAVRVIAPKKYRVQRIMVRRQCSRRDAEQFIDETDKGRADFVRRYFHRDVADAHLYDLVINLEHISRDAAADLILSDYKVRFEKRPSKSERPPKQANELKPSK